MNTEEIFVDFPYPYLNSVPKEIAEKYKVGSFGNVIKLNNDGSKSYLPIHVIKSRNSVNINSTPISLAKLVLYSFYPREDHNKVFVIHKDGNKLNDHLSNLKWSDGILNKKVEMTTNTFNNLPSEVGERWLPVFPIGAMEGFILNGWYVSNYGRIFVVNYNNPNGFFVKPGISQHGYCRITTRKMMSNGDKKLCHVQLHRLVLNTFDFNEEFEKLQVNHKDGNKLNNRLDNLEWCLPKENMIHAAKNNISKHGSDCAYSIYPLEMIYKVLDLYIFNKLDTKEIKNVLKEQYNFSFNDRHIIRSIYTASYRLYDIIDYMNIHGFTCSNLFTKEQIEEIMNHAIIFKTVSPFLGSLPWILCNTPEYVSACIIFNIVANNLTQFDYIIS